MSRAWARWQQQQQAKGTSATVTQQQQQAAEQHWQQLQTQLPHLSWQQLATSAVLPQEVVACAPRADRRLMWRAFDVMTRAAADGMDEAWMELLLKQVIKQQQGRAPGGPGGPGGFTAEAS
jgi:hypothetical protein